MRPDYADACYNLATILGMLHLPDEAARFYRRALEIRPDHVSAITNLALLLQKQEQLSEAIALFRKAIGLRPSSPEAYNNLGLALQDDGQSGPAAVMLRHALRLKPKYVEALNNLGKTLFDSGRFRQAEACFSEALDEQPQKAELHANLGALLQAAGRCDEALACFEVALLLDSGSEYARYNRGTTLLSAGRWIEGWPDYESRWAVRGQTPRAHCRPPWNGTALSGKTILIWAEQGLGDMIQFVRYAPALKAQGARVVVECPPHVVPLFRSAPGIDQIVTEGDRIPAYDVHCPLLSLPGQLRTTIETVPADIPYLRAPSEHIERWRHALGEDSRFRVGVAWRGSPSHAHDHWRSVSLESFAPLAAVTEVALVSLQKGPGHEEVTQFNGHLSVRHIAEDGPLDEAESLLSTAGLMCCLDLVICVDTAVAHLAGALGRPVWVALPAVPDWRWLKRGNTTPWYPSMRLYRQRKLGNWKGVFARMARDLRRRKRRAAVAER
ncbi:MAG TPA: tetratricopeptide repeat-containing glycosyltransferase family protein [Pirellulales bacterium]